MTPIIDQIIRTRRKTFALIVQRDGRLVVRAPKRATDAQIADLVRKKEKWINAKQDAAREMYAKTLPKEYVNGEGFLYLGKSIRLAIIENSGSPLTLGDRFYLSKTALPQAEEIFKGWYRQQALQVITERVGWYAAQNGFVVKGVKVTNARARWGSCSPRGTLNFAWRLVMAPLRVIDYVVVHELAHLHEKDHSRAFWNKVKMLMPDYAQPRQWLKANGHTLTF